jgi:hypothetical protein
MVLNRKEIFSRPHRPHGAEEQNVTPLNSTYVNAA